MSSNDHYHEYDVVTERPDVYRPRTGISHRSSGFKSDSLTGERPSTTRRIFRAFARFLFAVLVGVGATLAWQSYGDEATEMVRAQAPSLGWFLPVSTTKPAAPAVTSPEMQQQPKPIALDLAIVRRSVEQLAANQDQLARKQEQMAQDIATLKAAEQQLNQKLAMPPPPKPVHAPPPKSPEPPAQ